MLILKLACLACVASAAPLQTTFVSQLDTFSGPVLAKFELFKTQFGKAYGSQSEEAKASPRHSEMRKADVPLPRPKSQQLVRMKSEQKTQYFARTESSVERERVEMEELKGDVKGMKEQLGQLQSDVQKILAVLQQHQEHPLGLALHMFPSQHCPPRCQ